MKNFISFHLLALCLLSPVHAEESATIPPKIFEPPVEASDSFITAAKNGEQQAILEIFGDKHKELIGTAEPERDKELRAKVAAMAVERRRFRDNDGNSVAMVAWPADYRKSGVMTLLVNHYGDVHEKDLGPETATLAASISDYNPDETWTASED